MGDYLPFIVPVHALEEFGTNKIPTACKLHLSDKMLTALYDKHGDELNEWWKNEIGFGIDASDGAYFHMAN